ncbi:MAG: hypothetical protein SPJ13_04505 [Bacteroidales bacterium]|nr:hypothetical protein [Bacteroidales bacterium]
MLRAFIQNGAGKLAILLATTTLLWWHAFAAPTQAVLYDGFSPLYEWIYNLLSPHPFLCTTLALLLTIMEGIVLCSILSNHHLLSQNTLLPLFFYMVAMSFHPTQQTLTPALLVNLFTLLAAAQLMHSHNSTLPLSNLFNGALFTSMATLCYLPSITLFIPLVVVLILYRLYRWRHWMVLLLGLLAPFILLFVIYFMTNQLDYALFLMGNDVSRLDLSLGTPKTLHMVDDALLAVLLLIALAKLLANNGGVTNDMRIKRSILLLPLLANLFMLLDDVLLPLNTQLIAMPFAFAATTYALGLKRHSWMMGATMAALVLLGAINSII